jgi:hypothetical protein
MKRMLSSIGPYALDSDIAGLHGLAELSRAEYLALPKDFPDERIYKAPEYEFLGFRWNLLIGVINSRIYKISPQIITEDPEEAERAFTATFGYLFSLMGEPSGKLGSGVIWSFPAFKGARMPEGNVILERDRHGDVHRVQFFLTSGLPCVGQSIVQNFLTFLRLQFSAFFARLGRILLWSPLEHTDQENLNWCMARAVEWDDWPMWISLPIAPILFTFVSWLPVTVAVLVCNVLWWPIKHRWINLTLAELVGLFCRLLKWPISIACAAYLLFHAERGQAFVALLWPLVILLAKIPVESVMAAFGWPPQVGRLQKLFMRRLGYEDTTMV